MSLPSLLFQNLLLFFYFGQVDTQILYKQYLLTTVAFMNDSLMAITAPASTGSILWLRYLSFDSGDLTPIGAIFFLEEGTDAKLHVYNTMYLNRTVRLDGSHYNNGPPSINMATFNDSSDVATQSWVLEPEADGTIRVGLSSGDSFIGDNGTGSSYLQMLPGSDAGAHIILIDATVTQSHIVTSR